MPLFEQNLLLLIPLVIVIVEGWNACKRVLRGSLPPVPYEEERR